MAIYTVCGDRWNQTKVEIGLMSRGGGFGLTDTLTSESRSILHKYVQCQVVVRALLK